MLAPALPSFGVHTRKSSDVPGIPAPEGCPGEEPSGSDVYVPLAADTTVAIEGCSEPVTVAQLEASLSDSVPLRRGKWTREEEEFADHLIQEFQKGIINLKESTTMRSYLAQELHCPAMRISKKYHGNASMGLQMYAMMSAAKRAAPETVSLISRMRARRQYFRMQFLIKLYQAALRQKPVRAKPQAPTHHYAILPSHSAAPTPVPAPAPTPSQMASGGGMMFPPSPHTFGPGGQMMFMQYPQGYGQGFGMGYGQAVPPMGVSPFVKPESGAVPQFPQGGMAVSVGMSGGNMVYIPVMSGMPQMMFPQGYTLPTATPPTTSQPLAFSLPVPGSQPAYTYALPVPAPTTPPVFPLAAAVTVASPEAVTQSPTHLPSPTATAKPSTPPPTLSDASLLLEMREGESPRKA